MLAQSEPTGAMPERGIDAASFKHLSDLIRTETGIVLNESKKSLVVSRLSRRLRDLGLSDFSAYCHHLEGPGGETERDQLISQITTNVTRFFREDHHFKALRDSVLPPLIEVAKNGRPLRIWSAGCSSGQEPYSIAMSVIDKMPEAGARDVRILGTDIDRRMIEIGRLAKYRDVKKADFPLGYLDRFMREVPGDPACHLVTESVRKLVTLAPLNLLEAWPMKGKFDVIFCRNTVIYFDAETQTRLWSRFAELLTPGGHLFVGHSERVTGPAESAFTPNGITQYRYSRT